MYSIIIPFYNEKENLKPLYEELTESLKHSHGPYELIFVDDGSDDGSADEISSIHHSHVHLIRQRKRLGKGEALVAGVRAAKGEYLVFMDADLQDNPDDIHEFMKKMGEGYELVNGIRVTRKDNLVIKMYSFFANVFLKSLLHSPFTDVNCGFKCLKKSVVEELPIYGNNFRFLAIAAYYKGFKVTEIPVNNRPRKHGTSKYGIGKLFIGFIDVVTAYFLYQFSERPLHFFGMFGGVSLTIGLLLAVFLTYQRLFQGILLYRRPLLWFAILLIVVGIQIVMTGFIGELIVYFHKLQEQKNTQK